jgi:hypothetical protein
MTSTIEAQVIRTPIEKRVRKIPNYLIYEVMDGKPIYYKGYKSVLSGKLKLEDIMGTSDVQGFFINLIKDHLTPLLKKDYRVLAGELGVHLAYKDNLSVDIAIYRRKDFQPTQFTNTYKATPPLIAIEVDTKAALQDSEEAQIYFTNKTQKYLNFGVEQVIWVFTKTRKIWAARNDGKPWLIMNWDDEITILEQTFSINQLIKEDGFDPTQLIINQ